MAHQATRWCIFFLLAQGLTVWCADQAAEVTRELPEAYEPGKRVLVTLSVSPVSPKETVKLVEMVPDGWKIIGAAPSYRKEKEQVLENVYVWTFRPSESQPFTIRYIMDLPANISAGRQFRGFLKPGLKPEISTSGDLLIDRGP